MTMLWRRCSRALVQVRPDTTGTGEKETQLFFPSKQRNGNKLTDPETGQELDVLDMTALKPIAPSGPAQALSTGGTAVDQDSTEAILARFEQKRKHVPAPKDVGSAFSLGYPT